MKKRLYIAYGSNLNVEQMKWRCPTAEVVGATTINNYKLLFRGGKRGAVATVEPCEGSIVPALVWSLKYSDEESLDIYEGLPILYRKEMLPIELNGEEVEGMIYIMNVQSPENGRYIPLGQPTPFYFGTIYKGYKEAGFDVEILKKAVSDSVEM